MKASRLCLGIVTAAIVIGLFTTPAKAHADTYQVYDLGPGFAPSAAAGTVIYGITTSGYAILDYRSHGGGAI